MEAQNIAIDAVAALTDCDREALAALIRRFYLAGIRDPKRLTFKGLQAMKGRSICFKEGPEKVSRPAFVF